MVVLCGEPSEGISTERPTRKMRAVPVCSTVAVATLAATDIGSRCCAIENSAFSSIAIPPTGIITLAALSDPPALAGAAYKGTGGAGVYTLRYHGSNSGG